MIDHTAQVADVERSKQPLLLRRIEQGKGLLRLVKCDLLDVFGGVHAVPPDSFCAGMPGMAGGEQEDRPQAYQEN